MKQILILLSASMLLVMFGCKTTEKNYREAYERTLARDSSRTDFDETVYGQYRRDIREIPVFTESDTVNSRLVKVTVTEGGGAIPEDLKQYCVIAAEFKQLFNARSMRERLVEAGIPGAFVIQTKEPFYYVVAGSYAALPDALALLRRMEKNPPFRLPAKPYLLTPESEYWHPVR